MRTRGISRTLSSIYYGEFYAESCVTLTYLKSWHIQNQRHTDSTFKHLSWNILFKFLCHPDVFRTLLYTPLWYILKKACRISKMEYFIKNPMAYLDVRCIRNIRLFRMRVCQLLLNPFHATGLLLHLLKILENLWFSDVFRGYGKRPVAWNGIFKFLCHPDVFRTLLYTPLWYILKKACRISKMEYFIKNPMAYLDVRCIRNIRLFRMRVCQLLLNPFHATGLLLHLLKILENLWFSDVFRGYGKRPVAWNGLMYQLFFRTTNLLLLLYPLLLIESMTYSLPIRFCSQSLIMRYRALNDVPHSRYFTEFWNFKYGLRVKRKENYWYIPKCNNIKNNSKKRNSGK